jgi:2,3-bisphosphoglycerate-independent phosphoglycerate mutase
VYQDITRINKAVKEDTLKQNPALTQAMNKAKERGSTLHFLGLMSDGGVHSLMTHLYALIGMATDMGLEKIAVHAFLDGRDTPPNSGADYLRQLNDFLKAYPQVCLASVGGRYWGMDRDKRWARVEKAYAAMVRGQGPSTKDAVAYVEDCYSREEFDEFVKHAVVLDQSGRPRALIQDEDVVIFFNFRADRARELTWVFNSPDFDGFEVSDLPRLSDYVCMTQYDEHLKTPVAFPPEQITNTLAEVVSKAGLTQLHIAETEKYAHVTFFFNGGEEEPFPGEERILVPSPTEVDTYDQKPAMSAYEVSEAVLARLSRENKDDLIIMNYANGDMVGHTGVYEAARHAMEDLDQCLSRVIPAVLNCGGRVVLTSDHGNAEQMLDPKTNGPYTAHTVANPVPLILINPQCKHLSLEQGALCDVAPTVLALMGLKTPPEMTGKCLFSEKGEAVC